MDFGGIIMITVPIFFISRALQFDLMWFGVLYTIAIVIGYVTPPSATLFFCMRAILPGGVSTRVIFRMCCPILI